VLGRLDLGVLWRVDGDKHCSSVTPDGWYHLAGGFAISAASICLDVAPSAQPTTGPRA
jgi:hypothetical protein